MSKSEKAVFTNMCMISDGKGNILVQDRLNPDWPGVTFPGGHVEKGETFHNSVIREVKEETGLDIENPRLCGLKQFQTRNNERYIVLFYKTDTFSGELKSSDEGKVFWIKREEIDNYTLAHEFKEMLRVFEEDELSEFYYRKEDGRWYAELL